MAIPNACTAYDEDLSALLDEELTPEREAEVRAHVEACERCSARLGALCSVDLGLSGVAAPVLSPDLRERLDARIAQQEVRHAPPTAVRRRWLARPAVAFPLAAAAALALALWFASEESPPARESGPPLAALPIPSEVSEPVGPAPAPPEPRVAGPLPAPEQPSPLARPESGPVSPEPGVAVDLAVEDPDDLALALELETLEDLDLIANLDALERLLDLEAGAS